MIDGVKIAQPPKPTANKQIEKLCKNILANGIHELKSTDTLNAHNFHEKLDEVKTSDDLTDLKQDLTDPFIFENKNEKASFKVYARIKPISKCLKEKYGQCI
jgi:hypothetical protein